MLSMVIKQVHHLGASFITCKEKSISARKERRREEGCHLAGMSKKQPIKLLSHRNQANVKSFSKFDHKRILG